MAGGWKMLRKKGKRKKVIFRMLNRCNAFLEVRHSVFFWQIKWTLPFT